MTITNNTDGERREVDKNDGVLLLRDDDSANSERRLHIAFRSLNNPIHHSNEIAFWCYYIENGFVILE